MAEILPKLLILAGPHVDAHALDVALAGRFEVIVASDTDQARQALMQGNCSVVLADAGDFLPLERELVSRQSSVVLNALGEGVCLCDATGRVVWGNDLFHAFPEAIRKRVGEVCSRAVGLFRAEIESGLAGSPGGGANPGSPSGGGSASGGGRPRSRRFQVHLDKARKYYEVMVSPVVADAPSGSAAPAPTSQGGTVVAPSLLTQVAAVVRDVSGRERMHRKLDAIDRAGRELVEFDVDVVRKMHAAERLGFIERKVREYAHELLSFDHFAIRLLNQQTGALDLVMSKGLPKQATDIVLYAKAEGNGISGFVASTGRSYICPDCSKDPRYVMGLEKAGSSLTVPLRLLNRVIGVFNVESGRIKEFNELDRQFAEIFAHYIAMALHFLNLLLVEKYTTRESAAGNVQGEISEPLNDLMVEAQRIKDQPGTTSEVTGAMDRILRDVDAIRRRVKDAAAGHKSLLGIDAAISDGRIDPMLEGKRVLVADNEQVMRETVRDLLAARGSNVTMLASGREAIHALQSAAPGDYQVVISDINLGDRTGYEVFAATKEYDKNVPVILMTGFGYDPHHSIVRASQEGLQCVLFKPFPAEKLVDEVKKALGCPA